MSISDVVSVIFTFNPEYFISALLLIFWFVALLLFVGIPLPGTGAWTGTLAASLLDMDFKSSVLAVMLGVILAGLIMGAASAGLFGALFAVFS